MQELEFDSSSFLDAPEESFGPDDDIALILVKSLIEINNLYTITFHVDGAFF